MEVGDCDSNHRSCTTRPTSMHCLIGKGALLCAPTMSIPIIMLTADG